MPRGNSSEYHRRAGHGHSQRESDVFLANSRTLQGSTELMGRGNRINSKHAFSKAIVQGSEQDWPYKQELKVRVAGLCRGIWTGDVYNWLCRYGNIVRIDIQPNSTQTVAYVTFQPPPDHVSWMSSAKFGAATVSVNAIMPQMIPIKSPVDPTKTHHFMNILHGNSIDFGVKVGDATTVIMHTTQATNRVQMTLNLIRKELDFQFPLFIDGEYRKLRFRLPISLLEHIYKVLDEITNQSTLIIPFNSPPQFFMRLRDNIISKTCNSKDRIWIEWNSWFRITDVVDRNTRNHLESQPLMNHKGTAIIDIGRWTTYRISFSQATLEGAKYEAFENALADYGVVIKESRENIVKNNNASALWNMLQEEISGTHPHLEPTTYEPTFDELLTGQIHMPFPVRYQLEVCLSNGLLKEHNITRRFLEKLASMDSAQAVYILEKVADKQTLYYDPMDIFKIQMKVRLARSIPSHCVLSRSANITPTMIHVGTPILETSNRIIRRYAADSDRFIRIKFSDEKTQGRIHSQDDNRSEAVFARIQRAMTKGIVVAGRYYEFLAFGNSQFREHGAYFYAPTSSMTADQIRLSMGSFAHIKTVAKLGARLGQCFSTTRAIKSINVRIEMMPDIERNGFNFTDGAGKLSLFLAQMAARELGLNNPFNDPPSLFQFRLGGCKGVLALDPKITGSTVHIRPSQYKFEAQNVGLEIIRASAFAVACFNRQLIIVLSTLGVPDHIFIRKQQDMVNNLERAMKDERIALDKLQRSIDLNQTTLTMAGMILDGFMKSKDPFMMSLLQLWRAYTIKYLKEKARIIIEKGAFVLGCVDETASLRGHYDATQSRPYISRQQKLATLPEIFLQITDTKKKGHYKIIEGICVLARNPSLHPGDLRVVRAVNVPALHHLKNVVALPQTGDRDIASMCSGGDLDGDDYMVLWDTDFLPKTINEPPMDFTPEKQLEKNGPITAADITEFFITYMKNDTLARIAHAHLAQADYNVGGVRDEKCLELAQLHSQAVDYPKSGIPALMDRELRPFKWPHFMEKTHLPPDKVYKSRKVLGMLYDQVQLADFKPQYENAFDSRILDAFQLDDAMLEKAVEIKSWYDSALKRLMAKHDIRTEFEAWTVFALSHNQESRDYTFAEEFGRTVGILKSQFRDRCLAAAGVRTIAQFSQLAPFVAAMYTVTAREMEAALKECHATKIGSGQEVPARRMDPENMPLMSFPWLFTNELGKIATGDMMDRRPATIQQSPTKKLQREYADPTLAPDPSMGQIETEKGITHYGELLRLDFGSS